MVSIYMLQPIARLLPSIRVDDYVSEIVASRIPQAEKGCLQAGSAIYGNLTLTELYKSTGWLHHPDVVDWLNHYNGVGPHQLAASMLVVQALNDALTYADMAEEDLGRTCIAFPDTAAHYLQHPGINHSSAFTAAQTHCLPWIHDRFNHVSVISCKRSTMHTSTRTSR